MENCILIFEELGLGLGFNINGGILGIWGKFGDFMW